MGSSSVGVIRTGLVPRTADLAAPFSHRRRLGSRAHGDSHELGLVSGHGAADLIRPVEHASRIHPIRLDTVAEAAVGTLARR
jgi:hypothetical protein